MATVKTDELAPYIIGAVIVSIAFFLSFWINKRFISLSSLFHALFKTNSADLSWKASTLAGLVFVSTLVWNISGFGTLKNTKVAPFEPPSVFMSGPGVYGFMFSGFLVGLGTKLAGGGLTGHAFCGIPRLSLKSAIAVATFLGVGFLVATAKSKASFLTSNNMSAVDLEVDPRITANAFMIGSVVVLVLCLLNTARGIKDTIVSFIAGGVLAFGLMLSGLAHRTKVLAFLTFQNNWNSYILYALAAVIVCNLFIFNFLLKTEAKPNTVNIVPLIAGSAAFGLGLGITGLTPGTALIVSPVYFPEVLLFFVLPAIGGSFVSRYVEKFLAALRLSDAVSEINYDEF